MPDPVSGTIGALTVGSSVLGANASRDASRQQQQAADQAAQVQREGLESFERRIQPFADIGLTAADPLRELLGLPSPEGAGVNEGAQSLLSEINPLVSFLRDQGFEEIQESAAAQGRLGAGGTLRDLSEFNTNLASTVVPQLQNQRFNQLFNLLGLGANAATGQGTAGLQTAGNIGSLIQSGGAAGAAGTIGANQAINSGLGGIAGLIGASQGGAFGDGGFNFLGRTPGQSASIVNPNRFGALS